MNGQLEICQMTAKGMMMQYKILSILGSVLVLASTAVSASDLIFKSGFQAQGLVTGQVAGLS